MRLLLRGYYLAQAKSPTGTCRHVSADVRIKADAQATQAEGRLQGDYEAYVSQGGRNNVLSSGKAQDESAV
jgi:hypothetical protein